MYANQSGKYQRKAKSPEPIFWKVNTPALE